MEELLSVMFCLMDEVEPVREAFENEVVEDINEGGGEEPGDAPEGY